MSILGRLFRSSLEDPTVPLSSPNILEWLTGGAAEDSAGVPVSERKVLGLPAYYRAVAVTAGTLAGLPIKVYTDNAGSREKVTRPTALNAPNPRQTPFEYWMTQYVNCITWGSFYSEKVRDGLGEVQQVWPVHPSRVRTEGVKPSRANPEGKEFYIAGSERGNRPYTSREIWHQPYISPDGICGVRPLELFRRSLGIAIAGDQTAANLFKNGSRVQGILQSDQKLDDTTSDRVKARWKEVTSGPKNAGDIAVLGSGVKYQPIALPPGDAQLLESRQWSVAEIARMVGTPPHLIGDVARSTSWGTGIEQQVLGWVKFTLQAFITSNEQRVALELLRGGEYAKTVLEALLRGDSAARAQFYHYAITDGWLNRNEVRELEDREAVEGLDEFIVPSNMAIIAVDGNAMPVNTGSTDTGAAQDG